MSLALLRGGPLLDEFRQLDPGLEVLDERRHRRDQVRRVVRRAHAEALLPALAADPVLDVTGYDALWVNSVASLRCLPTAGPRPPVVLHLHELEYAISRLLPQASDRARLQLPDHIVAASQEAAESVVRVHQVEQRRVSVVEEFLPDGTAAGGSRQQDPPLVVAAGSLEWRKGADLFVAAALAHRRAHPGSPVRWVWFGAGQDPVTQAQLAFDIAQAGLTGVVEVRPAVADLTDVLVTASVFVLPSREDPFPLVVLEAARAGLPVVCFEGAGGAAGFAGRGAGVAVPYADSGAMAAAVQRYLADEALRADVGAAGRRQVQERHTVARAGPRLLDVLHSVLRTP